MLPKEEHEACRESGLWVSIHFQLCYIKKKKTRLWALHGQPFLRVNLGPSPSSLSDPSIAEMQAGMQILGEALSTSR